MDPRSIEALSLVARREALAPSDAVEEYAAKQSSQEPALLEELRHFTAARMPQAHHMVYFLTFHINIETLHFRAHASSTPHGLLLDI